MDIKDESHFPNFCSENERDTKDLVKEFKIETVTIASDIKSEVEDSTCSQNEEHCLMGFNETIKETEMETKIGIKQEHGCLETEDSCIGDIKDETHEDFCSTKPASLYQEGVSSYTSDIFSSEDLGNGISFKMNMGGPECENDRNYPSAKSVVNNISSIEAGGCLETSADGKIVSKAERIKPHKCNICNKTFTTSSHLKTHKLIHEGIKPHKCSYCEMAFTTVSNMKAHKMIHEGIKPHRCNMCNAAFTHLQHLKTHKLTHEGIKPHKCNTCNKAFTTLSNLKTHNKIHEGLKPHKCNICNKAFTELSNLKTHKLIHEGIKPHKCVICNKAFTDLSNMKTHKLIHERIKPHECNFCSKAFTRLSHLKTHKLVHESIKPHKCNNCNKAFTTLSNLKRHKLIHEDTVV